MKLTPALLEATYDFLRETPPFRRWGLLPGEEVEFRVIRDRATRGYHRGVRREYHIIGISGACIGRMEALLAVLAHEMIHLYQEEKGTRTRAQHNAGFHRLAKIVCRHHGYDPLLF